MKTLLVLYNLEVQLCAPQMIPPLSISHMYMMDGTIQNTTTVFICIYINTVRVFAFDMTMHGSSCERISAVSILIKASS